MKKILRFLTQRVVLTALLILIQALLLFGIIWKLNNYFIYFYAFSVLLSLLLTLRIINNKSNPAFKIAWLIPILLFPVLGGLVYLVFGSDRTGKYIRNKMGRIEKEMQDGISKANERSGIEKMPPDVVNQSHYISNSAHCPPYKNTTVEYLPMGEVKFERMVQELKKAKRYIFMEYFIIQEGTMWNTILEILERKIKQGVEVRLMYDDLGCLLTLPRHYDRQLREKGLQVCVFNPFNSILSPRFNNRDHRKICIIDGKTGFTGGINLADEYINAYAKHGHWKDTGVCLRGSAVWGMTVQYLALWGFASGRVDAFSHYRPTIGWAESIPHDGVVLPYTDLPLDDELVGETAYLNLIHRAKKYVYITTPYLIIDNEMMTSLCTAAKAGIDVRIITPHIPDKKTVFFLTRSYYAPLQKAGVHIYEYTPGFIHAKTMVCDDEYAIVGTINLDYRSLYLHVEDAVWMYRSSAVHDVKKDFLQTQAVSQEMHPEDLGRIGWLKQIWLGILHAFAPLV